MATSKADRAARLVVLAEQALSDGLSAPVMDDPRFLQMAFSGLTARVDGEIRKRPLHDGPWNNLTAADVRGVTAGHPGFVVLLAAHPNGFVRAEAVAVACESLNSPGLARMAALRTADAVPAIRAVAIDAIRTLLTSSVVQHDGGVLSTNVAVAARQIISTSKCLDTCPDLVNLSLDLVPPTYANGFPSQSDKEVHRRQQTLNHLQASAPADDPTTETARLRLIEWYERSLETVLIEADSESDPM